MSRGSHGQESILEEERMAPFDKSLKVQYRSSRGTSEYTH